MKLRLQVFMLANERFRSEIKRSGKQLLQRRLIFNDCLPKYNTENFVSSQFVLIETNEPTRRKSHYLPAVFLVFNLEWLILP